MCPLCPDSHRPFAKCSSFDGVQEDRDIASAENISLSQIEKETESQINTDRSNRSINVCDQGFVMKKMPDDKIWNDFNNRIQNTDNDNSKNDRAKPAAHWFGLLVKENKLNDIFNITEILSSKAALHALRFNRRHEITRQSKTTRPVVDINHLPKPAVTGQTGSQLKPSDVSRGTDSQISLWPIMELKTALDGEQQSIYPDDSDDLYSDENLEPEHDVSPGIDDIPAVSTDKDDAASEGEESTDSDYEFEVMKLFAWLDKKDWARSYYDCDDGVVIHVEPGQVEDSRRLLAEEFPGFQKYKVVETEPGVCTYSADPFEEDEEKLKETNNNKTYDAQNPASTINTLTAEVQSPEEQLHTETAKAYSLEEEVDTLDSQAAGGHGHEHVEFNSMTPAKSHSVLLQPGDTITSKEHQARFSGRIGSKGLTVSHIGPSNNIYHYSNDRQHPIGTMEKILEVVVSFTHGGKTNQLRTTADLGLLDLTGHCRVKNIIYYKGIYRLKLYKGRIKRGTLLRIIDQHGAEKRGKLISCNFNLERKNQDSSSVKEADRSREVKNMLLIQNEGSAISAKGDSGTLVTSIPEEGSNELFVYGIVTHLHKEEQQSATIANRLSDILDTIDGIRGGSLGLRNPTSNDIDFTEDKD